MNKIIVHHRYSHHASRSGYAKLIDYLENTQLVTGERSFLPQGLARLIKSKQDSKYGLYDSNSAKKNEELFRKLLLSDTNNTLVHYLNGERDIRQAIRYFKNVKSVATFHKPPAVLEKNITDTKYLKKLKGAIAVGSNQVDFLKNWLHTERVVYIPHGIDTSFFTPGSLGRKEKTVLFVGQHLRDFEALNYVIKKVSSQFKDVQFQIVLKKGFAKKVNPHNNVEFLTGINDATLKGLFQQATLLFLPLTDVTACNSLLEAMACGTPIVTTDLEANRGYGLNPENSILVPPQKQDDYVEAVATLLRSSESSLDKLSLRIRENAIVNDWNKVAKNVEFYYEIFENGNNY